MSSDLKRANTDDQKSFRRQQILDAAEAHFHDVGYEAFSMGKLARLAGVVKGTLYLYFKTREEVLLTLYNQSILRWSQVFMGSLTPDMTDHDYVTTLYSTAMADGSFVPLLIRLEHVIEHNVAIDSLIDSKRMFIECVERLAEATAPVLKLDKAQSSELVKTMGVLLVGATRTDQGPSLEGEDIPEDVQALIDSFSSESLFSKNACRIIAGIRAGDSDAT
ncbi:MAG: TetR/AcrR family transcriptional regulator [Halioglobus sp.]